jgi:hypothetical protein
MPFGIPNPADLRAFYAKLPLLYQASKSCRYIRFALYVRSLLKTNHILKIHAGVFRHCLATCPFHNPNDTTRANKIGFSK